MRARRLRPAYNNATGRINFGQDDTLRRPPLHDLSILEYGFVTIALLLAGMIKGGVGFGLPMVGVSLLTIMIPLEMAAAIVTVPIVISNFWLSIQGGRFFTMFQRFWPVILALGTGIFIGALILVGFDPSILFIILGVTVLVFTTMELTNFKFPSPENISIGWGVGAGFAGGITGGISTIWAPGMLIYLSMLRLAKDEFISAVAVIWFCGSLFLVAAFGTFSVLTVETTTLSAIATVPVIAGTLIGRAVRDRLSQELFRKIVAICLTLVALNLLRRGIMG